MDKINETIKKKLLLLEIDIDKLTQKQLDYLTKIEGIISDNMEKQEIALNELKSLGFSINSISDTTGISRQTFYNNPMLKKYIEFSIEEFNKENTYSKIKELKESMSEILEENTKMKYRDLSIELLKHDLEDTKTALKQKDREIAQLKQKNIQLSNKMNELRKEMANQKEEHKTAKIIDYDF